MGLIKATNTNVDTIVDMCNLLHGRKQQLIEVLDEFNYLCIEIADTLTEGRYKDFGASIQQEVAEVDYGLAIGYFDKVVFADKTPRLQNLYKNKEVIEGHESEFDKRMLRRGSYDSLKYHLALMYYHDFRRMVKKSTMMDGIIAKFDSLTFSASELIALGHILAFEHVEHIPVTFSGQYPSYLTVLRFFEQMVYNRECHKGIEESQQHECILELYMDRADVNIDAIYNAMKMSE